MIYTVTFNPAIDYVIKIPTLKLGEVNRVNEDIKYPGGKGINVSRVLNRLEVKSIALGFIGGFTGEYIKSFLENEGIETDFIHVRGDTRINIKVKSIEETEINGVGTKIEKQNLEELFHQLECLNSEGFIVLSGNVQNNLPRDIYTQIQNRCKNKKVEFVVDATGEVLLSTLDYKPFLIKPNIKELEELFNVQIESMEEVMRYGKKLVDMGAENVIVSMASQGALLICSEGVYHASAPKGIVKNSVGAGDSVIGGFLAYYSKKNNIIEAFRWGTAAGSATAFSMDLCTKKDVESLIGEVKVTKVK